MVKNENLNGNIEVKKGKVHDEILLKLSTDTIIEYMRAGSMWFHSPEFFNTYKSEGNEAIADVNDCANLCGFSMDAKQTNELIVALPETPEKFYIKGILKGLQIEDLHIHVQDPLKNRYRLLCFYGLPLDVKGNILEHPSEKLKKFSYSHCCVVYLKRLLQQISEYFKEKNIKISAGFVCYLSENINGVYNPIRKDYEKYAYQNEFRIILESENFLALDPLKPYIVDLPAIEANNCLGKSFSIEKLFSAKNINDLT